MPTFDFLCQDCDHNFEARFKFGQKPEAACPTCESDNTQKLFTAPGGIIFKGSGFYKNDSRPEPTKAKPQAPKAEPSSDAPAPSSDTTAAPPEPQQ